jgi:hypothetical protein
MAEGSLVHSGALTTSQDALTGAAYHPDNDGSGVRKAILSQGALVQDDAIFTEDTNGPIAEVIFALVSASNSSTPKRKTVSK